MKIKDFLKRAANAVKIERSRVGGIEYDIKQLIADRYCVNCGTKMSVWNDDTYSSNDGKILETRYRYKCIGGSSRTQKFLCSGTGYLYKKEVHKDSIEFWKAGHTGMWTRLAKWEMFPYPE